MDRFPHLPARFFKDFLSIVPRSRLSIKHYRGSITTLGALDG